eukprot:5955456-Pleurochrysis_carterae.AAC.1
MCDGPCVCVRERVPPLPASLLSSSPLPSRRPPSKTSTALPIPLQAPPDPRPSSCRCWPTRRAGGRRARAGIRLLHPRPIVRAV